MRKYSKRVILNYINGKDLGKYNIDELENNIDFMMDVIKVTKDKNVYKLCSNNIKNDYRFVKFMIEEFISDIDFIKELAYNYLKNQDPEDITYKELITIMSKIDNDELSSYKVSRAAIYSYEKILIEKILENEHDEKIKKEFGMGFIFIMDEYENSDILLNFFASNFIYEIFYQDKNLEEIIHKKFKDYKVIEERGINNYLISYISNFDKSLSSYLWNHLHLLKNVYNDIKLIGKNWDNYLTRINTRKKNIVYQELDNFKNENLGCFLFDPYHELNKMIYKFGLSEIFELSIEEIEDAKKENYFDDRNELLKHTYNKKMYSLLKDLFQSDIITPIDNDYNEKIEKNNKDSKLLSFSKKQIRV